MVLDCAFRSVEVGARTVMEVSDSRRLQAYGDGRLLTDFDFQVVHLFRGEPGPVDPNRVDAGDHGSEEERPVAGRIRRSRTQPLEVSVSVTVAPPTTPSDASRTDAPQCADSEGRLRSNDAAAKQQSRQFRDATSGSSVIRL